ncbi:MAG: hypothetical protein HYR66_06905 [Sphingobacteriales bacterium]|nr:hypothetical protein [Sphingobacteriales bacterium]MBI3718362.1 hypothetical protein [Sphingobacteriales bacterium]
MSVTAIKQQLQQVINDIDDEEILKAVLIILETKGPAKKIYAITEEQAQVLEDRAEAYFKGAMKTTTIEEMETKLRNKYGV